MRRRLLVCSLVLLGIANFASALSWSLGMLVVTRVAAAACAAAYTPNAGAVAAALAGPQTRARALAVVIGGLTLATALGVPIGHAVSAALSWRASLALVGVLSLVAATGVFFLMPSVPGGTKVTLLQRLAALRRPRVLLILPLTVLGMAACYTPYAFTSDLLDALRVPDSALTFMLFAYGAGAFIGNYLSGRGTDGVGPVPILAGTYGLMTASLGILAWFGIAQPPETSLLLAFMMACWGASSWAQSPAQQHRLIASAPEESSLVVALNSSCIYLGMSIGTAIGGQLIGHGASVPLTCGAALAALAFVYLLFTNARLRASPQG
ncbi:MFS transporter [Variovorax sp. J2P1-59]|uniref:MFS transporter n=1 Tax=Variovorax flavidus TaxID=3053501 RepID=UPI002574CFE9|nr:MFS transporter [Variovorax sp. J2P1-59]MDM0078514.1 MFS transporter [Variovorax sp. J2P1-59]